MMLLNKSYNIKKIDYNKRRTADSRNG